MYVYVTLCEVVCVRVCMHACVRVYLHVFMCVYEDCLWGLMLGCEHYHFDMAGLFVNMI